MTPELFVLLLSVLFTAVFWWGFRTLPEEEWQIIAAVPKSKEEGGGWRGLNLTYYGFFNATACALALAVLLVLMSAAGTAPAGTLAVVLPVLAVCIPASRLVARVVERRRDTFTVGGASFVGFIIFPGIVLALNAAAPYGLSVHLLPLLAAAAVAYAFGEATGRLACISFGCCYGKPLAESRPLLRRVFGRRCFVFKGDTKKVAYEGALKGSPVIPIQAVTATLYAAAGLVGTYLFLKGRFALALLVAIFVTQGWRAVSELFRADYRGGGRISAYQVMAVLSLIYALALLPLLLPAPILPAPDVAAGVKSLTNAWCLLLIEGLWVLIFLYTGRSMVTAARLSFHVVRSRN